MDGLSRSVVDGVSLIKPAGREGWALHFADLDIDIRTPAGEMAANMIISGSQYQRRLISQSAAAFLRTTDDTFGWQPPVHHPSDRRSAATVTPPDGFIESSSND